jgi:hypothetical protein
LIGIYDFTKLQENFIREPEVSRYDVSQNIFFDDLLGYTVSNKPDPTVICHVAHEAVFPSILDRT